MRACSVRSARICTAIALLSLEGSSSPRDVQARLNDYVTEMMMMMFDVHTYDSNGRDKQHNLDSTGSAIMHSKL